MNSTEAFRAAMRRAGLDYTGPIIADGKLRRFKAGEDHERNSWYVLFSGEPPAGAFGCWKRGVKERWCDSFNTLSPADRNRVHQQWMDAQTERARQEKDRQQKAREITVWILKRTQPLTRHPYLDKKGIQPHGEAREYRGAIALPLRDINGVLNSMQFIRADGAKRFLSGGRVAACFYTVAEKNAWPLLLCEGFATGESLHAATGFACVAALNCGNLLAVAKAARAKWPEREIIIAADNDAWTDNNPGLTAATAAANVIRAGLAAPKFKNTAGEPTDFNDLAASEGLATVRKQIESAFASGSVSLLLKEREFNPNVEPPPLRAIYTLAGTCIATPGNLDTITAAVKTGKTAVLGAMAASAMPHKDDSDLLGFGSSNPNVLALLWFDSEQSPDDFWHSIFRAVRRAGLQKPPAWLHSYCLTGLDYKAAWRCVQEAIHRGADSPCPIRDRVRSATVSSPQPRPVRNRAQSKNSPHPVRGLVQSVPASAFAGSPCPWPCPGEDREQFVSALNPQMSASRLHRVRAVDDLFPDNIRVSPHLLKTISFALPINFPVTAQPPA